MAMRLCPRPWLAVRRSSPRCADLPQVEVALAAGVEMIYADFEFIKQFPAVEAVRATGKQMRWQRRAFTCRVRTATITTSCASSRTPCWCATPVRCISTCATGWRTGGEASPADRRLLLNIANHKAVDLFTEAGCDTVTPSYDLNIQQMVDLLGKADTSRWRSSSISICRCSIPSTACTVRSSAKEQTSRTVVVRVKRAACPCRTGSACPIRFGSTKVP